MRAVVADTGPLNYMVLIEQVLILPTLFETVFVPEAVHVELSHPEAPASVREWIGTPPSWLVIMPNPAPLDGDLRDLGEGERAAIMLALSLNADLTVIDDRAAVEIARRRQLAVTGTIGLLDLGARRGLLDLAEAFRRLRLTSFRCRRELFEAILTKHSGT